MRTLTRSSARSESTPDRPLLDPRTHGGGRGSRSHRCRRSPSQPPPRRVLGRRAPLPARRARPVTCPRRFQPPISRAMTEPEDPMSPSLAHARRANLALRLTVHARGTTHTAEEVLIALGADVPVAAAGAGAWRTGLGAVSARADLVDALAVLAGVAAVAARVVIRARQAHTAVRIGDTAAVAVLRRARDSWPTRSETELVGPAGLAGSAALAACRLGHSVQTHAARATPARACLRSTLLISADTTHSRFGRKALARSLAGNATRTLLPSGAASHVGAARGAVVGAEAATQTVRRSTVGLRPKAHAFALFP